MMSAVYMISGCSVGRTIKLDSYTEDYEYRIEKIVVVPKIGGVIFDNKKVLDFDSLGGSYNSQNQTVSGVSRYGNEVILSPDSIQYIILQPYTSSKRSIEYNAFVEQQAVIDTVGGKDLNRYAPYLEIIPGKKNSCIVDKFNQTVSIRMNDGKYRQFSFDETKFVPRN